MSYAVQSAGRVSPLFIGVAGGTACGKKTVCQKIIRSLGIDKQRVVIVSQDSFYRSLTGKELESVQDYNFDHPEAFDWKLIASTLRDLKAGNDVRIPVYDFVTNSRKDDSFSITITSANIIIFEGILAFYQPEIRSLFKMKIFVDTDDDVRLSRRILRDTGERGRELEAVLNQYTRFVKPSFEEWILPTKKYADVIIPRGADNEVAIDLITQHIKNKLAIKSADRAGEKGKIASMKLSPSPFASGTSGSPPRTVQNKTGFFMVPEDSE